jgi:hypothetical protein
MWACDHRGLWKFSSPQNAENQPARALLPWSWPSRCCPCDMYILLFVLITFKPIFESNPYSQMHVIVGPTPLRFEFWKSLHLQRTDRAVVIIFLILCGVPTKLEENLRSRNIFRARHLSIKLLVGCGWGGMWEHGPPNQNLPAKRTRGAGKRLRIMHERSLRFTRSCGSWGRCP